MNALLPGTLLLCSTHMAKIFVCVLLILFLFMPVLMYNVCICQMLLVFYKPLPSIRSLLCGVEYQIWQFYCLFFQLHSSIFFCHVVCWNIQKFLECLFRFLDRHCIVNKSGPVPYWTPFWVSCCNHRFYFISVGLFSYNRHYSLRVFWTVGGSTF